jgi:hypothetical protein
MPLQRCAANGTPPLAGLKVLIARPACGPPTRLRQAYAHTKALTANAIGTIAGNCQLHTPDTLGLLYVLQLLNQPMHIPEYPDAPDLPASEREDGGTSVFDAPAGWLDSEDRSLVRPRVHVPV